MIQIKVECYSLICFIQRKNVKPKVTNVMDSGNKLIVLLTCVNNTKYEIMIRQYFSQ